MPSPTSRTRPTSRTSWAAPSRPISPRSTETISSGLNFITAPREELIADGFDAGADGTVEHLVPDLDDHPAQDRRVDPGGQHRLHAGRVPDRLPQVLGLGVGQR